MFDAVQAELRACPQWLLWKYVWNVERSKWTKVPITAHGYNASVTEPKHWCSFESACHVFAQQRKPGVVDGCGFVLGRNSGVCGLDVDGCFSDTGQLIDEGAYRSAGLFNSYTEFSPSRRGLHVLFNGHVAQGLRYRNVELYGEGRYFTITGDVFHNAPLRAAQAEADILVAEITASRGATSAAVIPYGAPETLDDASLWNALTSAANSEKFRALWDGNWQAYYGSQSEADQALINMIQFFSKAPGQIERMFKFSALGRRDKAQRADYMLKMLQKSFDNELPIIAVPPLNVQAQMLPPASPLPAAVTKEDDDDAVDFSRLKNSDVFTNPGGLIGDIAGYIYNQSIYPMPEVSIIAALGLMAGICGRQFQVQGGGLNLYLALLAETGSGKDAMQHGINKIMTAITDPEPDITSIAPTPLPMESANSFTGPNAMTGIGLYNAFAERSSHSFLSVFTEFSQTLAIMSGPQAHRGDNDLKKALLEFYNLSSAGSVFRGAKTADKKTKIEPIKSPALSIVTEGTPKRFYDALSEEMLLDGLVNRFVIVERFGYDNEVYNPHYTELGKVPPQLRETMAQLCQQVLEMKQQHDVRVNVTLTAEAQAYYTQTHFSVRERAKAMSEVGKQLYMRCHQNMLRMAALVAVGYSRTAPTIDLAMFKWAERIVMRQADLLMLKYRTGQTGVQNDEDNERREALRAAAARFLTYPSDELPHSMRKFADARRAGLIPYAYLQSRCCNARPFRTGRGVNENLRAAVSAALRAGMFSVVQLANHKGEYYTYIP